jgi:hypothetical protein
MALEGLRIKRPQVRVLPGALFRINHLQQNSESILSHYSPKVLVLVPILTLPPSINRSNCFAAEFGSYLA